MAEPAAEVVRRWFAALAAGDPAPAELPIPGPYFGLDGVRQWRADVAVRDGKIRSAIGYASPRRARRAAGL